MPPGWPAAARGTGDRYSDTGVWAVTAAQDRKALLTDWPPALEAAALEAAARRHLRDALSVTW